MTDERPRPARPRARSAPRRASPRVRQTPTSVPIYQTATFASGDAEELAAVLTGEQPGLRVQPDRQPDGRRPWATRSPSSTAPRPGSRSRPAWPRSTPAFLSILRAGDRLLIGQVGYGTTRTQALAAFGRLGRRRRRTSTRPTSPRSRRRSPPAARGSSTSRRSPTRPASSPTCRRSPTLAHRHGALLTVDNTFASPAVCRPLEHGADLVMESATKYLSGHSDVMAGAVVGSRDRIAAVRSAQIDTGATLGPFAAFLVLRGHRDARRAHGAPGADGDGTRDVPRASGRRARASSTRASRAIPSATSPRASSTAAARCCRSTSRAAATAGRAFFDALAIPERTASLGSVHTMVVHPPTSVPPLARRRRARRRGHHRGPAAGVASASRTRPTSSPTSRPRSTRDAAADGRRPRPAPSRPPRSPTIAARRPAARRRPGPARPRSATPSGAC